MTNTITVIGRVGAAPESRETPWGDAETTFRLASSERRRKPDGTWEDTDPTWFSVRTLRHLAIGVRDSLEKGQQVVVTGRLRVRTWETERGKGFAVEIDADHVGPDLMFVTAAVRDRPRPNAGTDARPGAGETERPLDSAHSFDTGESAGLADRSSVDAPQWSTAPVGAGASAGGATVEEPPF